MEVCSICRRSSIRKKDTRKTSRDLSTSSVKTRQNCSKQLQSKTSDDNRSTSINNSLSLDKSRASLASNCSDTGNQEEEWLGCSRCGSWVHRTCAKIPIKVYNFHKDNDATRYLCSKCAISGCFVCYSSTDSVVADIKCDVDTLSKKLDAKLAAHDRSIRLLQIRIDKISVELEALSKQAAECFGVSDQYKRGVDVIAANYEILQGDINSMRSQIRTIHTSTPSSNQGQTRDRCYENRSSCIIISGIPPTQGENLNQVVQKTCAFLDRDIVRAVNSSHRSPLSNEGRSYIIVQFASPGDRRKCMRRYFLNSQALTLKNVGIGDTDHRIIINEMLTDHAFLLRNEAIKLKHKKSVVAVHVWDNSISVRVSPGSSRVSVKTVEELHKVISEGGMRRSANSGAQSA